MDGGGGAQDTIYLCNFKVSVDGEWLCLREVEKIQDKSADSYPELRTPSPVDTHFLFRTCILLTQYGNTCSGIVMIVMKTK